jgi:prophage regulatory protein
MRGLDWYISVLEIHVKSSAVRNASDLNRQPLHVTQLDSALLNVKTVMETTGLSRSTIHAKVKNGTMPAPIKLSARCVRWEARAIRQWIDALASAK